MKQFLIIPILLLACSQQQESSKTAETKPPETMSEPESGYDKALANELEADQYGMHKYVLALLKKGPNRDYDDSTRNALQRAHLDNIGRLAEEGLLTVAGPFLDDGDLRGIYIFNVETVEEAQRLTETDPAIQKGSLVMELHPWYGSAGLLKVNEIHKRISAEEIRLQ
jgi:uncharacterized protein YciI